ncbi:MAG: LexA family protein [Cyanobium sp.]
MPCSDPAGIPTSTPPSPSEADGGARAPDGATAGPNGTASDPGGLDLARLLIRDPERTVLLRVCGESMRGAGIHHGDLLVVERRPAPTGAIVVARLGDRFTLKRLQRRQGRCWLEAAHPAYPPLDLEASGRLDGLTGAEVELWGVAVHVIHTH